MGCHGLAWRFYRARVHVARAVRRWPVPSTTHSPGAAVAGRHLPCEPVVDSRAWLDSQLSREPAVECIRWRIACGGFGWLGRSSMAAGAHLAMSSSNRPASRTLSKSSPALAYSSTRHRCVDVRNTCSGGTWLREFSGAVACVAGNRRLRGSRLRRGMALSAGNGTLGCGVGVVAGEVRAVWHSRIGWHGCC